MMTLIGLILDIAIILAIAIAFVVFIISLPVLVGAGVWSVCDAIWHSNDENECECIEVNNEDETIHN